MKTNTIIAWYLAGAFILTTSSPLQAGTFYSTFPAPNPPAGMTLYGNATILSGGGLQLNSVTQNTGGAGLISDLDPGYAVVSFTASMSVATTNGGGTKPADGWGLYFAAPGTVPLGSYHYESFPVTNGIAILFQEHGMTNIVIESGTNQHSLILSNTVVNPLIGNFTVGFSYDPANGAALTLTGGNGSNYTLNVSAAQLASDGLAFQPGYEFTLGGRVGSPGTTNADSHTVKSLQISTASAADLGSPVIYVQPANQTVYAGNNSATFTVTAMGALPLSYQWYTNSVADPGGNSTSYTISNVTTNNDGMTFQVVVTNSYGSTNSAVATLTVLSSTTANIVINCASNLGPVNPYVWGVGGPDKHSWWAGNTNLEQSIRAAKIAMVRVNPIQIDLYNGRDPYPSANTWDFTGMDAILNTVFDAGATPSFLLCAFPGGVSHSTNSAGKITNANWNAYATFMNGVVNHYNVQKALGTNRTVKYWEMWNEPDIEPDGTFASKSDYSNFVYTVGNAMKAVDPTIQLIGPVGGDLSSGGWVNYTAKNLSAQIDILCWHDYGPNPTNTDAVRMAWTPLHYRTNVATVISGGSGGLFVGPGGKHYLAAITEYNMCGSYVDSTFNAKYRSEYDATFAASAIINAMKGGADLFDFYCLAQGGTNSSDLLGLLNYINYSPYKPYYTFYLFGNYFGDQLLSGSGGTSWLEFIASKKTAAGTYTIMVVNKNTTNLTYSVVFALTNIPSASGSVLIHKVNATNDPVSYIEIATYTNSSFTYSVPPYNVIAFEFDPPPKLQSVISNEQFILSWNPPVGHLQSTPALTGASTIWSVVTTNNPATVPAGSGNLFFRVTVP